MSSSDLRYCPANKRTHSERHLNLTHVAAIAPQSFNGSYSSIRLSPEVAHKLGTSFYIRSDIVNSLKLRHVVEV
jgi:hypothetical protein